MTTIWKFPAPITDTLKVSMPCGARVLTVQLQDGDPHIWAVVDQRADVEERTFLWRGTGHPADHLGRYVGTVHLRGGALRFHLFEAP